jgi:hypothetical protein
MNSWKHWLVFQVTKRESRDMSKFRVVVLPAILSTINALEYTILTKFELNTFFLTLILCEGFRHRYESEQEETDRPKSEATSPVCSDDVVV